MTLEQDLVNQLERTKDALGPEMSVHTTLTEFHKLLVMFLRYVKAQAADE